MESRGEQENIIRGTRQRQFCPLPCLESGRMKSFNRLKIDPISGINTGVDVIARVGPVTATPGRMARRMKTPRRIIIIIEMGMSKPPLLAVHHDVASCEP